MSMKNLILSLFLIAPFFSVQAQMCEMVPLIEREIETQETELRSYLALQQEILQAREIQAQIVNTESGREILLLAERLDQELELEGDLRNQSAMIGSASLGSLVLAGYFIRQLSQSTQGLAFKARLMAQIRPTGEKALVRTLLNTAVFVSVVSTLWNAYQVYQHQSEVERLRELVLKLNELWDLTGPINEIREHLEELSIQKELLIVQHQCGER